MFIMATSFLNINIYIYITLIRIIYSIPKQKYQYHHRSLLQRFVEVLPACLVYVYFYEVQSIEYHE